MKPQISVFTCYSCRQKLFFSLVSPRSFSNRRNFSRPTNAPKPYLDVKHIRQNPGLYEQNCTGRNYKAQSKHSWRILELHHQWQDYQREARNTRERNNKLQAQLSKAAYLESSDSGSSGEDFRDVDKQSALEEAKSLRAQLGKFEQLEKEAQAEMESLALELPNLSSHHTPSGHEPEVLSYINTHPSPPGSTSSSDRVWRSHTHIGAELGLLDFTSAATTSGWGWYYLTNEAALLEQALIQYTLNTAMKKGWRVVSPPSIVYSHIASACGFLPRDQNGEQQIYALEQAERHKEKPSLVLAGTAEIPLAALKASQTIEPLELPLKLIGASRCYRAEAGARGVDTKGLYRVHEFTKVEMFAWTLPSVNSAEGSNVVFDEMLALQTQILQSLDLHCRVLEMPSTDLGASASRKIDIEAFFPSRRDKDEGWGEVTSASICTDYQARRLATRVRVKEEGRPQGRLDFPHTLNGTAMAVPRVLAAILENGWDESSKSVRVPEVLRPWMGGIDIIQKKENPS